MCLNSIRTKKAKSKEIEEMFRAARKLADHNPAAMAGWYVRQLSSSVLIVFLLHEGFNTFSSHVGRRRKMLHTFLFEFMYGFLSALLLGIFSRYIF